jgi:hypothetical protein
MSLPALDERRKVRRLLWHMQLLDSQEHKKSIIHFAKEIKGDNHQVMDEVEVL